MKDNVEYIKCLRDQVNGIISASNGNNNNNTVGNGNNNTVGNSNNSTSVGNSNNIDETTI